MCTWDDKRASSPRTRMVPYFHLLLIFTHSRKRSGKLATKSASESDVREKPNFADTKKYIDYDPQSVAGTVKFYHKYRTQLPVIAVLKRGNVFFRQEPLALGTGDGRASGQLIRSVVCRLLFPPFAKGVVLDICCTVTELERD